MAQLSINGTGVEYGDAGHGDPVVLVHGSASDARTWDGQREPLARAFRVIHYSRRYHWPNAPIPAGRDYSMSEHVADLEALLLPRCERTEIPGAGHMMHEDNAPAFNRAVLSFPDRGNPATFRATSAYRPPVVLRPDAAATVSMIIEAKIQSLGPVRNAGHAGKPEERAG